MKRYIIIDPSGKVELYDDFLYDSIKKNLTDEKIHFFRPSKGLLNLVPKKYRTSGHIIKRLTKVIEGFINYCYFILVAMFLKPSIIHFQWLPFLEVNLFELYILKIIRFILPSAKLVLTIHNIYPHNMSSEKKIGYNERFRIISLYFDDFIVHTNVSKNDVIQEFGITPSCVSVCCHGVFVPSTTIKEPVQEKKKFIVLQFGGQSYYKGTDLLVDAINALSKEQQLKVETHIVGGISSSFLSELKKKDVYRLVKWKPYFLSDEELYEEISNADLIVLPYRAISQSGVLLLSLYFEKFIICSDLSSFVETMRGDDNESLDDLLFFKSEDVSSLTNLLQKYVDGIEKQDLVLRRIKKLKSIYSWNNAAIATLSVYKKEKQ